MFYFLKILNHSSQTLDLTRIQIEILLFTVSTALRAISEVLLTYNT